MSISQTFSACVHVCNVCSCFCTHALLFFIKTTERSQVLCIQTKERTRAKGEIRFCHLNNFALNLLFFLSMIRWKECSRGSNVYFYLFSSELMHIHTCVALDSPYHIAKCSTKIMCSLPWHRTSMSKSQRPSSLFHKFFTWHSSKWLLSMISAMFYEILFLASSSHTLALYHDV